VTESDILARMTVAVAFGALVGIERQWHHKNAGIKTHTLVAIGAATFALISEIGLGPGSNPAQIAAGVVTGIGFIGGGVIMRRGTSVQGINSAATLWATGSLGLAVGGGHYALASLALVAILAAQVLLQWLSLWVDKYSGPPRPATAYSLLVAFQAPAEAQVRDACAAFAARPGVSLSEHGETRSGPSDVLLEIHLSLMPEGASEMRKLNERLAAIPGVSRAEWSKAAVAEHD
jgi:putative Mg2+ transporter-C (MgtC) family protein